MKKTICILIFMIAASYSAAAYNGGDGTAGNPYQISTAADLAALATSVNAFTSTVNVYFIVTADIDLTSYNPWTPIGKFNNTYFRGNFNGNNKKITNLVVNNSSDYSGLFGYVLEYAVIQNLTIENCSVSSSGYYTGGLIGMCDLTTSNASILINNCSVSGTVSGLNIVGGLIGKVLVSNSATGLPEYSIKISNCSSTASVQSTTNDAGSGFAGGLIGDTHGYSTTKSSEIINCYATGSVTTSREYSYAGGLLGVAHYTNVTKCYATGNASAALLAGSRAGGLSAEANTSTITNCYSTGSASGMAEVGGFIGLVYSSASVNNCYSTGASSNGSSLGGFIGFKYDPYTVSNCFWDTEASGVATSPVGGTGKTTVQMKTASTFTGAGWDVNVWNMDAGINNGYPYLKWQNPSGSVLPVELISFIANTSGGITTLHWRTANEVNSFGFEVEKRSSMNNWQKIGFVEGNGTTNSMHSYSYSDRSAEGGTSYRLKQIDRDGKSEYSQIVEVNVIGGSKEFLLEQNYPNPFNPTTVISYQLPVSGNVSLKIFDNIGREVSVLTQGPKEAGKYSVHFDGSKLSNGVYIAQLCAEGRTQIRKLLLVK